MKIKSCSMKVAFAEIQDKNSYDYKVRQFLDRFREDSSLDLLAAKSHNLRMILLQEAPTAFCVRNIFVSANALSRA